MPLIDFHINDLLRNMLLNLLINIGLYPFEQTN